MTPSNIAIVLGPNLLWTKIEGSEYFEISSKKVKIFNCSLFNFFVFTYRSLAEMAAATSVHVVTIIEPIIQHADWFFPEGRGYKALSI